MGKIHFDANWTHILLGLRPGEKDESEHYLSAEAYNNLKKGRYRIIKDFSVSYNFPSPSETDPCFKLCAKYEIE